MMKFSIFNPPSASRRSGQFFKKGFTFIDVIVGIALMLIVFLGIFGAYQLGMKVVTQSKNRVSATAIANQWLEKARNLPYELVGIKGGFPDGALEAATTTIQNNIEYTINARVDYVVDSADGIAAPDDECPNDYKRIEVKVSWAGRFSGEVKLSTDVAPKNLAQECATGGGILLVTVFDAYGEWEGRGAPLIEIKDSITNQTLKTATPADGKHYFSLATSTYKVVVSKDGYSSEQTFGSGETYNGKTIITPEKPHLTVLEGQLTEVSFSIDEVAAFSVDTLSLWGSDSFSDSFLNESKISEKSNVVVSGGKAELATSTEGYLPFGYLISIPISPENLIQWDKFSFANEEPEGTDLKCQIYYATGTDWALIPDSDLAGNSIGFDVSPVDLSNLATTTYSQLKLKANFSTEATSTTPILYDWQLSWKTSQPTPIGDVTFNLKGQKVVGTDADEDPIYKYSENYMSNPGGQADISDLEWDNYTFSLVSPTNLNLVGTDPEPQPISLAPKSSLNVKLFLKAENSLLVTVQNQETLEPVFSAQVRLYNLSLDYDQTQYTNEKGQTYFIPLEEAVYDLRVEAPGYLGDFVQVSVSGDKTTLIKLEQVE